MGAVCLIFVCCDWGETIVDAVHALALVRAKTLVDAAAFRSVVHVPRSARNLLFPLGVIPALLTARMFWGRATVAFSQQPS
jgi:hypothetical protein